MASMNTKEKTNVVERLQALNIHFSDKKSSMEIRVCISILMTKL